jgi:hypothetical protein
MVAYAYARNDAGVSMQVASSGSVRAFEILLPPESTTVSGVLVNGRPVSFAETRVGDSRYVQFETHGLEACEVKVAM